MIEFYRHSVWTFCFLVTGTAFLLLKENSSFGGQPSIGYHEREDNDAKAGNVIVNTIGMKLVYVPPGSFLMGSSQEEISRLKKICPEATRLIIRNGPQHDVELTHGFYIGIYEVTIGQFRTFVTETGYRTEAEKDGVGGWGYVEDRKKLDGCQLHFTWKNIGWSQSDDHPVVNVTWNDAKAFCSWLSKREDRNYGLPTEAQWEYACRAGTKTTFQSGDDPETLAKVGNTPDADAKKLFSTWKYAINSRDGFIFTAPVGQFRPNNFGLYDMHGNASEWCEDWFDVSYYANSPKIDPFKSNVEKNRVLRGGSWADYAVFCTSAFRYGHVPSFRFADTGFRVIRKVGKL